MSAAITSFFLQPWNDELDLGCYAESDLAAREFAATLDVAGGVGKTRIAEVKGAMKAEARRLTVWYI